MFVVSTCWCCVVVVIDSVQILTCNADATVLNSLSYDAMLEVLSHLSVQELGRLSSVSQNARDFADDEVVWRRLCRQVEGDWSKILRDPSQQQPIESSGAWKDDFRTGMSTSPSSHISISPSLLFHSPHPFSPPSLIFYYIPNIHAERQRLTNFSNFVGLWSEKWCDVHVVQSTLIETDGTHFYVTYKKNKFQARFQSFDGDSLAFHLEVCFEEGGEAVRREVRW